MANNIMKKLWYNKDFGKISINLIIAKIIFNASKSTKLHKHALEKNKLKRQ